MRARCRWFNEGEKNTKYFLNLEKRHFKQATISQLKQTDGSFVTTDKEILNHCEAFYKELYRSKISSTGDKYAGLSVFDEPSHKKLSQFEQGLCEDHLTKEECPKAVKEMECNKTPGSDGLPAEFYKVFCKDVSDFLINSFNCAYLSGHLSVSQKRGIIKLIPREARAINQSGRRSERTRA